MKLLYEFTALIDIKKLKWKFLKFMLISKKQKKRQEKNMTSEKHKYISQIGKQVNRIVMPDHPHLTFC